MTMKVAPDCIECMFRQALNTARQVTDDWPRQLVPDELNAPVGSIVLSHRGEAG